MPKPIEILQKYWNHKTFRSPQEEIIQSVLDGKDTFGLMPTGGGKSICFQVPALLMEGICIVISPLVALMKDQVQGLQKKGIKAIALTGGISTNEIINLLDNCEFGDYKFLYLSPERLQNDWILERIKKLPVNLIAIDEAHCVSQWGHDFRPSYLKIAQLKEYFPKTPFLALTASATKAVQEDLIQQLQLNQPNIYFKSFRRENLAYMVYEVEDKLHLAQQILEKNPAPSIIYVVNRKSCWELANQLRSLGFTATYYHGGLSYKEKETNMNLWMDEKAQVMVATNAFGMGIDKANVKTVLHLNLPLNLENYYQEAGRAGRNGDRAYAVLLTSPSDYITIRAQFINVLPDKAFLNTVFVKLCNFFQIAYGEGVDEQYNFNLNFFCVKYNLNTIKTFNAIQFLDRQGIITMSQEFSERIKVQFTIASKEVIRYMSLNPNDEEIVLAILRTYPGIYENAIAINPSLISKKSNRKEDEVLILLKKLNEKLIIDYNAKTNDTTITFNEPREDERTINRVSKYLVAQNELKVKKLKSVLYYTQEKDTCKSRLLLRYFGENSDANCGICSYCLSQKTKSKPQNISEEILSLLENQELNSRELQKTLQYPKDAIIFALQKLLEEDIIIIQASNRYSIKK